MKSKEGVQKTWALLLRQDISVIQVVKLCCLLLLARHVQALPYSPVCSTSVSFLEGWRDADGDFIGSAAIRESCSLSLLAGAAHNFQGNLQSA